MKLLGPQSETLNDLQLELLADEEPGTTLDEVEAEAQRAPLPAAPRARAAAASGTAAPAGESAASRGSRPCAEQTCRQCGAETAVIGYDESEQLDVEPARLLRAGDQAREAGLPLLREGHGDDGAVGAAHRGEGTGQRSRGGGDGGRQVRGSSAAVPAGGDPGAGSGTGDRPGHAGRLGDARRANCCSRWSRRCGRICCASSYLQADETIVPVQMHDKRGADHQAYLWQYGKPGGETVFDFRLGRGREGPQKFLGQWEGILQTDGYQAYDGIGGPKLVHVGCWAHARRKFVDAVKVNPGRCRGRPDGDADGRACSWWTATREEADDGRGAAGGCGGSTPRCGPKRFARNA